MVVYLISSALAVSLFYLLERLFLRRSTLFYAQRSYYSVAILASLLLPLVALLSPDVRELVSDLRLDDRMVQISVEDISATVVEDGVGEEPSISIVARLLPLLLIVWGVGVVVMLIRYMYGHVTIARLLGRSERHDVDGVALYLTESDEPPFTYLQSIAIPRKVYDDPSMSRMVLEHELVHVHQRHYVDMLFGSLLQILQWWNPFAWGLTALQKNTLEYIADSEVLRGGVPHKEYQLYLLKSTIGRTADSLLLSFSMYNLKQRIFMMNRKKTTRRGVGLAYLLIALPVLCCTVLSTQALNAHMPHEMPQRGEVQNSVVEKKDSVAYQASFPGGMDGMRQYLKQNIKYPQDAKKSKKEGKVHVYFRIATDGTVKDVEVKQGVMPSMDAEAIRVIQAMPKWLPARDGEGKPVEVGLYTSVDFELTMGGAAGSQSEVLDYVDDMPEFPGGTVAMMKFLSDNIRYPEEAVKKNLEGRVMVSFVIEKDGSVSNTSVVRGIDPLLDAEAMRVVGMMPKWKPGMEKGKPVRTRFTAPIKFSLGSGDQRTQDKKPAEVLLAPDEMPEFPGGPKELMKWLADNIKYPAEAIKQNIQGRVLVGYIVKADGTVTDVKIIRGVDPLLDEEAMRVVGDMPKWKPAMKDGKPVAAKFNIPVTFRFESRDAKIEKMVVKEKDVKDK